MKCKRNPARSDGIMPVIDGQGVHSRMLLVITMLMVGIVATPSKAQSPERDPVALVQELYAAFNANDLPGILALVDQNVVWVFHGPEHRIPYAGTYKGRDGVEQFFKIIADTIDVQAIDQRHFSVEEDVVTVLGWERAVHRRTEGEYEADWVHVFTVRNGYIVRFEEVTDSGELLEAFAPADPDRGKAYFTTCIACHGVESEGNVAMHAPNLTVQGVDYLVRQLRHFRTEVRGGVKDFYGWQMNGRAKALPGDRAVRDVVAYIETLPDAVASQTLAGDAAKGEAIYTSQCASCHGQNGEGNELLGSPPLAGLQDWYQLAQLESFSSGLRGAHESDVRGSQMRPFAVALDGEEAMQNVVAYIATLEGALHSAESGSAP
jgi:cytochrome c553